MSGHVISPPALSPPPTVPTQNRASDDIGSIADRPRLVTTTTSETRLIQWGSMLSALALVWLLYYNILPFSGVVGYVVCTYVAYLAIFTFVTAMSNPRPVVIDRLVSAVVSGGAVLVGGALLSTIVYTWAKGWAAVHHSDFFTQTMAGVRPTAALTQGGILHALVGTLIELGIATAVALPLGIATAVFMVEVRGRYSRIVRTVVEAMTALPDILAGLFIYTVLIVTFHFEKSGFAAAMALTVMMLPIIARAADVALRVVPNGLREAGLALGASQWSTVWRVVLPTARSGLATAVLLGMARAVGETAPVLITSGASTFLNTDPFHNPMNSLPLFIFSAVRSGEPQYIIRGFGAAIVLLVLVLVLFGSARYLSRNKIGGR